MPAAGSAASQRTFHHLEWQGRLWSQRGVVPLPLPDRLQWHARDEEVAAA